MKNSKNKAANVCKNNSATNLKKKYLYSKFRGKNTKNKKKRVTKKSINEPS